MWPRSCNILEKSIYVRKDLFYAKKNPISFVPPLRLYFSELWSTEKLSDKSARWKIYFHMDITCMLCPLICRKWSHLHWVKPFLFRFGAMRVVFWALRTFKHITWSHASCYTSDRLPLSEYPWNCTLNYFFTLQSLSRVPFILYKKKSRYFRTLNCYVLRQRVWKSKKWADTDQGTAVASTVCMSVHVTFSSSPIGAL